LSQKQVFHKAGVAAGRERSARPDTLTADQEPARAVSEAAAPLRHSVTRAALTSGGGEIVTKILTIVLSIATARALEPREVGILGLAVIIVSLISMIGYYPEVAAVAAREKGHDGQFALAASVIRAGLLAVLLTLAALSLPALAEYLAGKDGGSAQLRGLLAILCWSPLLEWLSGYPQVLLQRRLDLSCLALAQLLQPVIFVGLAILLLGHGYGYTGVAWANVAGTAVVTSCLWQRLWRRNWLGWEGWPALHLWRATLLGSVRVFVGGFGGYLGERLDNLLVAGAIGPTAMSFYAMAWNAARAPANIFARAIGFALIPTFARIQQDPARVRRGVLECLQHSYLLLTPVCAALFVAAPELVSLLLGAKWLPLVPALRIMCVTALVGPLLSAANAVLVGTGRAQFIGLATGVRLLALILIMQGLARRWGIIGAAYGDLVSSAALTVTLCAIARRAMSRLKWPLAPILAAPLIAAVSAGLLAWGLKTYLAAELMRLMMTVGTVLIGYAGSVILLGGREKLFKLAALLQSTWRQTLLGGSEA
jgi:O-antigen/teichoic acid export membrane protein